MEVTKLFTTSGSWVCPAGVKWVSVIGSGGGGGGGGGRTSAVAGATLASGGAGGGAGYYGRMRLQVTPGTTYTITVGAGGTGGGPAQAYGGSGASTSFDTLAIFTGGTGGSRGFQVSPFPPGSDRGAAGGFPDVYSGSTVGRESMPAHFYPGYTDVQPNVPLIQLLAKNGGHGGYVMYSTTYTNNAFTGVSMAGDSCVAIINVAAEGAHPGGNAGGPGASVTGAISMTNLNHIGAGGGGAGAGGAGGHGGDSGAVPVAGGSAAANTGAGGGGGGAGDGVAGTNGGAGGSGFIMVVWDE